TLLSRALHGAHHTAVHHEGPDVNTTAFLDEFLHDHTGLQAVERLADRHGRLLRLGQHHAQPLRAFQQLDDAGRPADIVHDAAHILAVVGEHRLGDAHTAAGEDLHAAQLVAAAHQRLALGGGEHLHHLELPHDRR